MLKMIPREVLIEASSRSLLDARRLNNLWNLAKHASLLSNGPIVEFGSYKGGSAYVLQAAIESNHACNPLHLFDTFCGMPAVGPNDQHHAGDFADTSVQAVQSFVPKAIIHKCDFVEWFMQINYEIGRLSFVHIDVDLEQSTHYALEYAWRYLMHKAWIVVDDYNAEGCEGAKRAVDKFLANAEVHSCFVLEGPHPQILIRKDYE